VTCSKCHQCNWGELEADGDGKPSLVVLASAVVHTTFKLRRCCTDGCDGMLRVDGREHALLAFGYCLLHRLNSVVGTADFPGFFSFLRQALQCAQNISWQEKRGIFRAYRQAFQAAYLDYVTLMRIDYTASFWCPHVADVRRLQLVVDGIAIGWPRGKSLLWCPWAANIGDATELVAGSKFEARVFVRKADMRMLLWDLGSGKGLTMADIETLRAGLAAAPRGVHGPLPQATLLPFLEAGLLVQVRASRQAAQGADTGTGAGGGVVHAGDGDAADAGAVPVAAAEAAAQRFTVAPTQQQLFMALGSSAPACQVAKPHVWDMLHKVVGGTLLSAADMAALAGRVPSLWNFIRSHALTAAGYPAAVKALVKALLGVAEVAFTPQALPTNVPLVRKARELDKRVLVSTGQEEGQQEGLQEGRHSPGQWSHYESFLRTGVWCSAGIAGGTEAGFVKTELGGSHVRRRLHDYLADRVSETSRIRGAHSCTKHKQSTRDLTPGLCLGWCHECRTCVFMAAMANAESPRTVFEVVYAMFEEAPGVLVYDNFCTTHQYMLNREPEFFKMTDGKVDALHYKEHTRCAPDYDSGLYKEIDNSQLAEQKNAALRRLGNAVFYMHQHTFLTFGLHWLHRMHCIEKMKAAGECWWA
jgi:hypothetical protein